jgi:phosphatidylserine/phosphatidylglycerophosphate/cardiolipin synthase-like enzyme
MRALPLVAIVLAACQPPDPEQMFNAVEVFVEPDASSVNQRFIAQIDSAQSSLHVALPEGDDPAVADALLRAWDRGVMVEVITDIDLSDTPAVAPLVDAGLPTTLADDGVAYFDFNINQEVVFPSESCRMSHAFVVADEERITSGSAWGRDDDRQGVVLELRGEDLVTDILLEHNQIYGGTDATTTTAYDANAKSITDFRWMYRTTSGLDLEMWFGPQERLTKRIIDAIYGARSDVRVLTGTFFNDGLARALQDKAEWGLDVQLVVGSTFDPTDRDTRDMFSESPDVPWSQLDFADPPTIVLIDYGADPEGYRSRARAIVLSHDLVSGPRLYRGEPVVSDQLIDGTLWGLGTSSGELPPEMLKLLELFDDHLDQAVPL